MKALIAGRPGGPEVLQIADRPEPKAGPAELLVRVRAAGVNRPDILQRKGQYPPPAGASDILGLELAGEVVGGGAQVPWRTADGPPGGGGFAPGDRVFALVAAGACAEWAVVDHRMAMRVPASMSFAEAAAVPENFFTASENLFALGRLAPGETLLVHAAGSGVGIAALLLAREAGARVLVTSRTAGKIERLIRLGAVAGCDTSAAEFDVWVREQTAGAGADVILDLVGAPYWVRNLRSLRPGGRLLLVGLLGGASTPVDLGELMRRRVSVIGSVLRSRRLEEKIEITRRFLARWLEPLAAGRFRPVIHSVLPLEQAAEAHRLLESGASFGKVVLET